MRHYCLAISCARLTGPFPAAPMSVQVGQRNDRSVGLSRHLGDVGLNKRGDRERDSNGVRGNEVTHRLWHLMNKRL
jgi:hypothetical protein